MADFFKWNEEYLLQISEIDKQHKYFVSLINELYEATVERMDSSSLVGIIARLADYAEEHFATEEKYFNLFKFSGAEEHKAEHAKLRDRVREFSQISELNSQVSFEIIDFLESWLLDHLVVMDKKYVACFHDHGLR